MKRTLITLSLIAALTACDNTDPKEEKAPPPPSQATLNECQAPHIAALSSGKTKQMRSATNKINSCLEKHIIEESITRLGGPKSPSTVEQSLKLLRTGYQRIQWEIATEDISCRPDCGTVSQLTHVSAYNELLIQILDQLLEINTK